MRRLAAVILVLLAGRALAKNEMLVDARSVQASDLVTITISLEGAFAAIEEPFIPLRNLRFAGEPSVSSEFAWVNGEVSRRKTFRINVRPIAPGAAQIGPVVLEAPDGQRDTLAAVTLDVQPARTSGSNDAEVVLRELLAAGRAPVFVIAAVEKRSAYAGEPIVATWFLYNAAAIQEWQVVSVPKLAEFWVEELPRGEAAERLYVGDVMMQRVAIRRAVLFPLRSGRVRVEGLTIEASVMQRTSGGPFGIFEGTLVDTTFTSAPFDVDVKALPPGPPVDAVGELSLRCEAPAQRNGGPVVMRATLEGVANLRAAAAPRFEGTIAGTLQTEAEPVVVNRDDAAIAMSRRWQFLIFPSSPGALRIPPLAMRVFVPSTGARRELRCAAAVLDVVTAAPPSRDASPPVMEDAATPKWPWIVAALAGVAALPFAGRALRRELALRRAMRDVLRDATPDEIRARVAARVAIDPREASDRGDAWRALLSLLDAKERERDIAMNAEKEIRRRVREVLRG